ncbi:flagellar assembly protein FliH [Geopseudomonas sagittaria]|uniref:Flagellar assembly protein FliH n=1 Tax=Geopseudomonas sagittaria TaxID=1135990 RepID=A0A1I5QDM2_9GAMM|nr:flagellar assembly protein FliH [Pseudomonas sagittaria]SFP44398.1 flagellar assembly protein FliH [Pseudomonas sagittaria]
MSERRPPHVGGQWQPWQMDELGSQQEPARQQREAQRQEALRQAAFKRNAELQALREQAQQQAREQGYQAGFAEGRNAGYAAGLEEGRRSGEAELQQQLQQTLQPLQGLAAQFRAALAQLDEQIAAQLVDLALVTGRQLAGEALELHPEQILEIVRELLHSEPALSGQPRLWLHPADLLLVKAHLGDELEAAGWRLQPDGEMTRGGCRVAASSGELDATRERRWEALAAQVRHRQQADGQLAVADMGA